MGFVGGGGKIEIAIALPHHLVYCIVNIKQFVEYLYLIFYSCLRHWFLDVETNPGPLVVLFLLSAEYSVVLCRAWPRTLVVYQ